MPSETSKNDTSWTEVELPTRLESIREAERKVLGLLKSHAYSEDDVFAVRLAFEEALINAMKHGNRMDPDLNVHLAYRVTPECVEIRVADEGCGFDPCCVPDPTCDENLARPCGRGVMLMRSYMDEVEFSSGGNQVHMVKYRGEPSD